MPYINYYDRHTRNDHVLWTCLKALVCTGQRRQWSPKIALYVGATLKESNRTSKGVKHT